MDKPYQVMSDTYILPAHHPIPGIGFLPINAFVIKAAEPVLVDTGMVIDTDEFIKALKSIMDPQDLKWIWLTHDDADHTGSIQKIMEMVPEVRLAANALSILRLGTAWQVPINRVHWLNSGDSIDVGDRKLTAIRPPLFDNPSTIGIFDESSEALLSADCFGAIIPSPEKNIENIREIDLTQGMISWASADSPWVHMVDPYKFSQELDKIYQLAPKTILSSHLPFTKNKTEQFLKLLKKIPTSEPFVAPNQAVLLQMLDNMKGKGQSLK